MNDDPNRPETEADGQKAGALRVAGWKHQNEQLLGRSKAPPQSPARSPASSQPQSNTPETPASRTSGKASTSK